MNSIRRSADRLSTIPPITKRGGFASGRFAPTRWSGPPGAVGDWDLASLQHLYGAEDMADLGQASNKPRCGRAACWP